MPDLTAFFFDLEIEFDRPQTIFAEEPDRLRAFCRRELESMGSNDVLIFGATGFYLLVRSRDEDGALALAQSLNRALQGVLFANPQSETRQLFQMVRHGKDHDLPRRELLEEPDPAGPVRSRDSFAELALSGKLPADNVELTFTPVKDLRRGRITTFFCVPALCVAHTPVITGYQAFEGLDAGEMPAIDRAILAHALKFARRLANENVYASIGTPISFETLVSTRGRATYQEAMRAAGVMECAQIFAVIRNIPSGVTASRLADIVACVRPLVRHIFVQLPDTQVPILSCASLGASGFSLRLSGGSEPQLVEQMAGWLGRVCETQSALSCIEGIDDTAALSTIAKAGTRYGAGLALGSKSFRGDAHSLDVETFMRSAARAARTSPMASVHSLRRPQPRFAKHVN
jgi:hypothetical protein